MKLNRIRTVLGVLALGAIPALADIAYIGQPQPGGIGNGLQDWLGSLGMTFTVNSAITVNDVGVYNWLGPTGAALAAPLTVAIYNTSTGFIVNGTEFTFNAGQAYTQLPGDSFDLFQQIAPVQLAPGGYEVVAVGFGPNQFNGNQGFAGGVGAAEGAPSSVIKYTNGGFYSNGNGGTIVLPTIADGGPANRYDAGTFAFSTPEPGFYGVLALGLAGLAVAVRRKRA
jgi:hypothetical protein